MAIKLAQTTLDQLSDGLTTAARSRSTDTLPQEVYRVVASYINARIFTLLISAAITVTIVFVLYGSFLYFTAYGDENRATNAKKTITYAFVGLLIAFMAMGIAAYVQQSLVPSAVTNTVVIPTN